MSELFGSPFWIIGMLVLLPVGVLVLKLFKNKKCSYCKAGVFQEVSATPVNTGYYSQNNSGKSGGHSTSFVRMKVKYKCSNCGEFFEVHENR